MEFKHFNSPPDRSAISGRVAAGILPVVKPSTLPSGKIVPQTFAAALGGRMASATAGKMPAATAAGFTLPELMVSIVIGSIVLLFAGSFYVFSMRSFTVLANYVDLNSRSRSASDLISRDVRSALSVQSLVNNQLILNEPGGTNVTYTYSPVSGKLIRNDGIRTQVLLTGITPNSFAFYFYGRPTNSTPVFEDFPTNSPNGAKLVGFKWACSRNVTAGAPVTSDSLQTAIVNLRNQ